MDSAIASYVPDSANRDDPHASPIFAKDHSALPRALVITAGFDVLVDGGLCYLEKLEAAGVDIHHRHFDTMPHGFITMSRLCKEADLAIDEIAAATRH
jgi:acetyl esterase